MSILGRAAELYREDGLGSLISGARRFILFRLKNFNRGIRRWYLQRRHGRHYTRHIEGSLMQLDLNDTGISTDLAVYGTREVNATKAYQSCLVELADKTNAEENVVVVDVGANIGYYALQPPAILGNQANVIAIEPVPENISSLEKNIALNEYENQITVAQAVVGAEEDTVSMTLTDSSNLHTAKPKAIEYYNHKGLAANKITVDERPLTAILEDYNIDPVDVDVLRFDVQGYGLKVLQGARSLFNADSTLLLNIEIHPSFLSDEEVEEIIGILDDKSLQIVSPDIDNIGEIRDRDRSINLVMLQK